MKGGCRRSVFLKSDRISMWHTICPRRLALDFGRTGGACGRKSCLPKIWFSRLHEFMSTPPRAQDLKSPRARGPSSCLSLANALDRARAHELTHRCVHVHVLAHRPLP